LFKRNVKNVKGPRRLWVVGLAGVLAIFFCADCARLKGRLFPARSKKTPARELHALAIAPDVAYVSALDLGDNRRLYYSDRDLIYAEGDHFYPIVVQGFPRVVGKSPSGDVVAFLEPFEFEMVADLYVFDVPARSLRRLTEHRDHASTVSVKAAQWYDDRTIYYLQGYRYGTVSRGGDLWRVDVPTGERHPIVQVVGAGGKLEEIVEFEFVPGGKMIRYVVARNDEDGAEVRRSRYCTLDGKPLEGEK
jgi:hypothetical protein